MARRTGEQIERTSICPRGQDRVGQDMSAPISAVDFWVQCAWLMNRSDRRTANAIWGVSMAYQGGVGGTFKNLWSPDLSTRDGALSGTQTASTVLFIIGGLRAVILLLAFGPVLILQSFAEGNVLIILSVIEVVILLIAAFLLRQGKGAIMAIIATVLYFLGMIFTVNIISLAIGILLLAALIGGVRGALALRRGQFSDDVSETFV